MSAPNAPAVSVVVPAYNAAATLAATLASAAAQTLQAIEIVIVDDGSTDATAVIARAFCRTEPRARLVRQANRGVAAARNHGIALAGAAYVAPLDADDLWHPDKLAQQLAVAHAAPEPPGLVYCWSRDIDTDGRVWADGPGTQHAGMAYLRMLAHNFVGNGSVPLLRRDAVLAVGGYDESLRVRGLGGVEDIVMQLRLAARHPVAVAPSYLVGYRAHGLAMSADQAAMFNAWRGALAGLDRGYPQFRATARCNLARRQLLLAETMAGLGRWPAAARHALPALARDPVRGALTIAVLIGRRLGSRPGGRGTDFFDLAPEATARPPSKGPATRLHDRLDAWRDRRLDQR